MSDIVWVLFDLGNVLVEVEQERIFATIAPLISKDVQFVKAVCLVRKRCGNTLSEMSGVVSD